MRGWCLLLCVAMCACAGGSSPTGPSSGLSEARPATTAEAGRSSPAGVTPGVRNLSAAERRELRHRIQKELGQPVEAWAAYMRNARRECQLDSDAYEDLAV